MELNTATAWFMGLTMARVISGAERQAEEHDDRQGDTVHRRGTQLGLNTIRQFLHDAAIDDGGQVRQRLGG